MPSVTVKTGRIEVSYEGEQSYIEGGLLSFINALAGIAPGPSIGSASAEQSGSGGSIGHTTSQIAQIISASTGPDLAMAAMAHLTLAKGQDKVQRADILAEMKAATSFYKENYSSNLTSILNGLVKKKMISPISSNVYALPNGQRKEFEEKLKNE